MDETRVHPRRYDFASDNCSGICPQAWQAMQAANDGCAPSYGEDQWTARASDALRRLFDCDCEVFFVFNGTAANSLALASICQPYHSIIAHEHAHIETDECGGPEFYSNGTKILVVPGDGGKMDLDAVAHTVRRRSDIHYPKPKAISVTQANELGGVYTIAELEQIGELKRRFRLNLHMDGARLANAIVSLGVAPKEITWKIGVDVLCLGGSKNGIAVGDCVIFFNRELAADFAYRCKQAGQLASKMRYLSAPWLGLLDGGVWLENAALANTAAQQLKVRLETVPGVRILTPVAANSVFVQFPNRVAEKLHDLGWQFYNFIGAGGSRLMCSWNTSEEAIDEFVEAVVSCVDEGKT